MILQTLRGPDFRTCVALPKSCLSRMKAGVLEQTPCIWSNRKETPTHLEVVRVELFTGRLDSILTVPKELQRTSCFTFTAFRARQLKQGADFKGKRAFQRQICWFLLLQGIHLVSGVAPKPASSGSMPSKLSKGLLLRNSWCLQKGTANFWWVYPPKSAHGGEIKGHSSTFRT